MATYKHDGYFSDGAREVQGGFQRFDGLSSQFYRVLPLLFGVMLHEKPLRSVTRICSKMGASQVKYQKITFNKVGLRYAVTPTDSPSAVSEGGLTTAERVILPPRGIGMRQIALGCLVLFVLIFALLRAVGVKGQLMCQRCGEFDRDFATRIDSLPHTGWNNEGAATLIMRGGMRWEQHHRGSDTSVLSYFWLSFFA